MIIFIIALSLLIESLISYYFTIQPMLFISTLIIYLIRNNAKKKTIYIVLGSSLIYDLFFGNIYFLYLTIFIIIYILVTFVKIKFNNNTIIDIILFIISLILFKVLKFFILSWIEYNIYSISFLLKDITSNLTINIIYGIILYYILGIKLKKT